MYLFVIQLASQVATGWHLILLPCSQLLLVGCTVAIQASSLQLLATQLLVNIINQTMSFGQLLSLLITTPLAISPTPLPHCLVSTITSYRLKVSKSSVIIFQLAMSLVTIVAIIKLTLGLYKFKKGCSNFNNCEHGSFSHIQLASQIYSGITGMQSWK